MTEPKGQKHPSMRVGVTSIPDRHEESWDVPLWHAIIQDHNTFGIEITSYRRLFGKFRQVSSVTMLASLPLQLAKFPRKYAAPALTIIGERSLKILCLWKLRKFLSCISCPDTDIFIAVLSGA